MCSKNYAFFSLDVLYARPQIFFGKNRAYCIWVFMVVAWPSPSTRLQQTKSELWQLSGRYYPNCSLLHCVWHLYTIVCILVQTVHTSVALGFTMFSCTYFLTRSWFLFIFSAYFLLVVVSLVVIKCLKRLVSKMTYCVSSGTLNSTLTNKLRHDSNNTIIITTVHQHYLIFTIHNHYFSKIYTLWHTQSGYC